MFAGSLELGLERTGFCESSPPGFGSLRAAPRRGVKVFGPRCQRPVLREERPPHLSKLRGPRTGFRSASLTGDPSTLLPRRSSLFLALPSSPAQKRTDAVGGVSVLPGSFDPETVDRSNDRRFRTVPTPQTRKTPNKRWDARPSFFPTSRISCRTKSFWGVGL